MGEYIGLMDCNNFFVSCERLFRPDLWHKPVAVLSSNDGCIVARSNEVKALGVPMGIPLFQAKQLVDIEQIHLFSSNFTLYRDISTRVMNTLAAEVGDCEVYSVDEAFFSVPADVKETDIYQLRARIMQKTGIPISIGVGKTKTLAKAASEVEKKGSGVCYLTSEKWQNIATKFPCVEVWNLGRATATKLQGDGITMADEFMGLERGYIEKRFGVNGRRIQDELRGMLVYKLGENSDDLRKTLTSSGSFAKACSELGELESALSYHIMQVATKLRAKGLLAGRLQVSVRPGRHGDWVLQGVSGAVPLTEPTNDTKVLTQGALQLLREQFSSEVPYKKAGVTLSGIVPVSYRQLPLFGDETETKSQAAPSSVLDGVTDFINERFGKGTLHLGTVLSTGARASAELRSQEYTTAWRDIPRVMAK